MAKKIFTHKVSVKKDSNKVYGCSESDIASIRVGNYFRIFGENILYQVNKITNIMPIFDFEVINKQKIKINQNTNLQFIKKDVLDISYKEYELAGIFEIINKGKNYKKGEVVKLKGGAVSSDTYSGLGQGVEIVITEIDNDGGIVGVGLEKKGKYIVCPPNECEVEGFGDEAKLRAEFDLLNQRQIIERTIEMIEYNENFTHIILDYPLPLNLKEGKLSCQKTEIILDKPYLGETDPATDYEITRDFTSYLNLPIPVRNSFQTEMLVARAFTILDAKIKELDDKSRELEEKLRK